MNDAPSCQSCRYFVPREIDGETFVECRRYPPELAAYSDINADPMPLWLFPQTDESEWCGEYKAGQ